MIFDVLDEEKDGEIELKEFVDQMRREFQIVISLREMD